MTNEDKIQAAFFDWLALNEKKYPELGMFFSIPNGTNKSFTARMIHKATGLKSGVPDTCLPLAVGRVRGLWIEFKSETGKLSDTQAEWILRLKCAGHRVEVCKSWTDAANVVIDYLALPISKLK